MTGWEMGQKFHGGHAEYASVKVQGCRGHGGDWRCVAYMSYSYSNNNSTSYIPLDQLVYKGFPPGATIIPIKQASTFF